MEVCIFLCIYFNGYLCQVGIKILYLLLSSLFSKYSAMIMYYFNNKINQYFKRNRIV